MPDERDRILVLNERVRSARFLGEAWRPGGAKATCSARCASGRPEDEKGSVEFCNTNFDCDVNERLVRTRLRTPGEAGEKERAEGRKTKNVEVNLEIETKDRVGFGKGQIDIIVNATPNSASFNTTILAAHLAQRNYGPSIFATCAN